MYGFCLIGFRLRVVSDMRILIKILLALGLLVGLGWAAYRSGDEVLEAAPSADVAAGERSSRAALCRWSMPRAR